MSCEQARAAIADSVIGAGATPNAQGLDAHLASCAACRAYGMECRTMWDALGKLTAPTPSPGARARFETAIRRQPRATDTTRAATRLTRRSLIAAGFACAVLLGYGAASFRMNRPLPQAIATPDAASRQYLLLLYDSEA